MTNKKHTPGPWFVREIIKRDQEDWHNIKVQLGGGNMYLDLGTYTPSEPWNGYRNAKANATLIAAAPDLLAACEIAVRYMPDIQGSGKTTVKKAINKAKGA